MESEERSGVGLSCGGNSDGGRVGQGWTLN